MNDLLLYRLLHEEVVDTGALTPLVQAMSAAPLRERFPFLGAIARLTEHEDAGLRVAAIEALSGADGGIAFRALVRALDDADDRARAAAVESLRASSASHVFRFAHALFHPDAKVRSLAIEGELAGLATTWSLALVVDPATRDAALARVDAGEDRVTADTFALMLDLDARGHLDRARARSIVLRVSWPEVEQVLAGARGDVDPIDRVVDLLVAREGDAAIDTKKDPFRGFAAALGAWDAAIRARTIVAIKKLLAARGDYPDAPLFLVAAFEPSLFADASIPLEVRRRAVEGLYVHEDRAPKIADERVRELLDDEVFKRGELLDLYAVGGLMRLVKNHPYKRILQWLGADVIVASFFTDPPRAIAFFSLEDSSTRGKTYLLERIALARPDDRARVAALFAIARGGETLAILDADPAEVTIEIAKLAQPIGKTLTTERIELMAASLAKHVDAATFGRFLAALAADVEGARAFSTTVVIAIARASDWFVRATVTLDVATLRFLLALLATARSFPYAKERELAEALASHADDDVRAWATARLPLVAPPLAPPAEARALDPLEADAIANAPSLLAQLFEPCLKAPPIGLADALKRRARGTPSAPACAALLAAHDPIEHVDAELVRHAPEDWSVIDRIVATRWLGHAHLALLANVRLHRWERHGLAAFDQLSRAPGLRAQLAAYAKLRCRVAAIDVWSAAASVLAIFRWRDLERMKTVAEVADDFVEALASDLGEPAARGLMAILESRVIEEREEELRARVVDKLPDLGADVRAVLGSWVDARGLATTMRRDVERAAEAERVERVRRSHDLDFLESTCRATNAKLAEEAALRLLSFDEAGAERIERAILAGSASLTELAASIALFPEGPSLARLRARAADATGAEVPFRIAIALVHRGERSFLAHALSAGAVESEAWLRHGDLDELRRRGVSEDDLAVAFAPSPHPHAYRRAVEHLVKHRSDEAAASAIRAFLERGTSRSLPLRRTAARWLLHRGDFSAFPILLEEHADAGSRHLADPNVLAGAPAKLALSAMDAIFTAGARVAPETIARDLVAAPGVDADVRDACNERILIEARHPAVRSAAARARPRSLSRALKLREIAESFAWGIRMARQLTGRVFKIDMIGDKALGFTRLHENRIHVTPLPILTREPNGKEIVEGLVLHEIGHHVHHRGEIADGFWKRSAKEGIQGLFNVVLDEHLERNLRARDADFGDKIKVLDAWAFQHAAREIPVHDLVMSLLGEAFGVLSATTLEVARAEGCVRVSGGAVLRRMEARGLSFSRFFRALRMGLGDRHADPRVARGLALFNSGFRHKSIAGLYAIAVELRNIFGWETRLVERFGGHETDPGDGADLDVHGDGITNEDVEEEVERILDPTKRSRRRDAGGKGGGKAWINVSPDEAYKPIHDVVKIPFDSSAHAVYARAVARDASKMRRWLEELGLGPVPQRFRLQGKRFDRSRANALVVRGDPRVLIARVLRPHTDLFLGILVDCSGSMQARQNIEKAKHFAVLLAEAARELHGATVRVFGFTDTTIYDAGDARHCAAHGLSAGGGNNDAGALAYVAKVALASTRRAKVLVMISDGLPTECSAAALRALVQQLGKKQLCCAQVAVKKLAEECFPHYVVLESDDRAAAVTKFGAIVAGLVRRAIAAA